MSTAEIGQRRGGMEPLVGAATAGDESAFSQLVNRYRREVQVHTYRILGSHEDSEDLTQETFLRAWRMRESFQGRSSFRAWLYRIATNASLSALERSRRRQAAHGHEVAWSSASPDGLLEGIASTDAEPDVELDTKETFELAFLAAVKHLPPRQRAVLFVRDVLDWSAQDTAELLETSVASVNSALQRARATLRTQLPGHRLRWAHGSDPSDEERALLQRYLDAAVRADADTFVAVLREDTGIPMPAAPRRPGPDVAWDSGR